MEDFQSTVCLLGVFVTAVYTPTVCGLVQAAPRWRHFVLWGASVTAIAQKFLF